MSRELMVVLIVAIVMIASVMRARYGHRRRSERSIEEGGGATAENQRLRDEVKQLRDRLAVLERIAVEKENSLEREIEALRDQR